MPRAMWTGTISFGLVNVPVRMYTAARSQDVRFNQIHAADGARVRQKRVCSFDEQELSADEIVRGYEIARDQYVTIEDEELAALAPAVTNGIEIEEFVDLAEIDPVFFESSYYLAPARGGAKAYGLLQRAMRDANKVALGRVVLRNKQYLVALRPVEGALSMSTLYYADEVVQTQDLEDLPGEQEFTDRELGMARQLIDALSAGFEPGKYRDEYRERLMDLIERKAAGETVTVPAAPAEETRVVDIMAALEASIAAARAAREKASA